MSSYIAPETLKAIIKKFGGREGVYGTLICDRDGLPLQSDLPAHDAEAVSAHVASLVGKVEKVAEEIGHGELSFVTVTLTESEVLVAPEEDFTLVVLRKKKGGK
ncbi:MAG: roadblock/LC7 domain-containing protein [Promethearchaeota archaeon]